MVQGGREPIIGEEGMKSSSTSASAQIVGEDGIIGEEGRCVTRATK